MQVLKEKSFQPRILYLVKLSFTYKGGIKAFPEKLKLRESITTKPALQGMLTGVLKAKMKTHCPVT